VNTARGTIPLRDALAHADPRIRRAAIQRLREAAGDWRVPLLAKALRDPDVEVAVAAAGALGRSGSDAAVAPLVAALHGNRTLTAPRIQRLAGGAMVALAVALLVLAFLIRCTSPPIARAYLRSSSLPSSRWM